MAGLSDLYATPGTNLAGSLAGGDLQGSDAAVDTGLAQSRLLKQYSERSLPALTSAEAARGSFYSGHARTRASQLTEDVGNQYGDLQRNLDRTLAGIRRQGILSTLGVVI